MEVNFFSAQLTLWKRIFDYKGTSTRKEFWYALLFHVILGIIDALFIAGSIVSSVNYQDVLFIICFIPVTLLNIYLLLSIIPGISLTVRRLRDAGKSEWWVLLLFVLGIGHALLLVLCATASVTVAVATFKPFNNFGGNIYGPPEMLNPSDNIMEGIYGPPDYNPDENEPQNMYGPPVEFGPLPNDFNAEENEPIAVYGPPEMFE